jgi:hydrophobe/amphiphile efflux-1 (HAE1) family protein
VRIRDIYVGIVGRSFSHTVRYMVIYLLIVAAAGFLFLRMPTSYIPDEDQGILMVQVMLPSGSTLEQTETVLNQVRDHFMEHEKEGVASIMTVAGVSFGGMGQNMALGFVKLKDWNLRQRPDLKVKAIAGRAMGAFSHIKSAMVFAFAPPPVTELGMATGFDFQLQDRGGLGHEKLMAIRNQLLGMAAQDPRLVRVRPNGMNDVAEYRIDVDWDKAGTLGLSISSIHNTISAAFGSAYVNDFIQAGRVKKVYAQVDAPYRMLPEDLKKLYVRNNVGKMVPFSSFATCRWAQGSPKLERYNAFPSINIWGEPAPGRSTGEAMTAMEEIAAKLPQGIGFDWNGLSYQERMATSQASLVYAFSIFVIFLCLAALYESWPIPISILLTLVLGAIGGVIASSLRGLSNDVYFQIGLLTTLGLTTKNAILIVQFAKKKTEEGMDLVAATVEGAKLRFRPIIMTSLAFGFGVLPLVIATGAGAGAMNAIGTGVLGGMLTATILVMIFSPLFYVWVRKILGKRSNTKRG